MSKPKILKEKEFIDLCNVADSEWYNNNCGNCNHNLAIFPISEYREYLKYGDCGSYMSYGIFKLKDLDRVSFKNGRITNCTKINKRNNG